MPCSCNKNDKIEYKATAVVFFIIVLTVHKYEKSMMLQKCRWNDTYYMRGPKSRTHTRAHKMYTGRTTRHTCSEEEKFIL